MRDEGVIYVAGHPLLNRRCETPRVYPPPKWLISCRVGR